MTLEITLLVLESVLLVVTVVLLVMSLREGRGRDSLIIEVGRAIKVLSRHEYFITVIDAMMDSEKEVIGSITGRTPIGEDKKRTREVIYNIEKLVKAGVTVRYILPKFQDRLHVGWLYTKAGAEVRYSACQMVYDFRYMVVDGKAVLIGVPESTGEKEATRKGYKIPSEGLAVLLRKDFYSCWEVSSLSYEEYMKETIKDTGATPETLARELKVEMNELKRIKAP